MAFSASSTACRSSRPPDFEQRAARDFFAQLSDAAVQGVPGVFREEYLPRDCLSLAFDVGEVLALVVAESRNFEFEILGPTVKCRKRLPETHYTPMKAKWLITATVALLGGSVISISVFDIRSLGPAGYDVTVSGAGGAGVAKSSLRVLGMKTFERLRAIRGSSG